MLLTLGSASRGDYGEESLVAKFLIGLLFNEYSAVNANNDEPDVNTGKAFADFSKNILKINGPFDMTKIMATTEFQANRCCKRGDNTTFDALLSFESEPEPSWIWGIEAKYFDILKPEQMKRESYTILNLMQNLERKPGNMKAGLLFITPEDQLISIAADVENEGEELRQCIRDILKNKDVTVKFASWEMIFNILGKSDSRVKADIKKLVSFREINKPVYYDSILYENPEISDPDTWEAIFEGDSKPIFQRKGINIGRVKRHYGKGGPWQDVLKSETYGLAEKIISRLPPGFLALGQKGGYVNLSKNNKAYFQLHYPKSGRAGLAFVIREAEGFDPVKNIFEELLTLDELSGYGGPNKSWLNKKDPKSKARAFLIPLDIEDDNLYAFIASATDYLKL